MDHLPMNLKKGISNDWKLKDFTACIKRYTWPVYALFGILK